MLCLKHKQIIMRKSLNTLDEDLEAFLEAVIEIIKDFKPETVRDEEDFEKQLFQTLKYVLEGHIARQYNANCGRPDIVVDDTFAFELKIANKKTNLVNLKGQIDDYLKEFKSVTVILLDTGDLEKRMINQYVADYKRLGANSIIIKGKYKPRTG